MSNEQYLNLGTKVYPENREGGLMICGLNWGGTPNPDDNWNTDMVGKTFFSDHAHNNQKGKANDYNNRIVKWFELLGHPLATTEGKIGEFEKSVLLTTWLRSQSKHLADKYDKSELARESATFEFHVGRFHPKLIIFPSVELLEVINLSEMKDRVHNILGYPLGEGVNISTREVIKGAEKLKSFRIGIQRFSKTDVIALPHPTGSVGLSDAYIEDFKDIISKIIATYKATRGITS